jgi:DNA-binding LacI/PurR family transcriptional regulator
MAGVSRSTVSLAINHDPKIKEATRVRIWEVIEEVGYAPNAMARSLARLRSDIFAVVVPANTSHVFSDYYFSEAMSGINDAITPYGFKMLLQPNNNGFVEDKHYLRLFRGRHIDGMLVLGALTDDSYVRALWRASFAVVLVNSRMDGVPCIAADNYNGAKKATEYLTSLGHQRIATIRGLMNTTVGIDRFEGYCAGLDENGSSFDPLLVADGNFSEESGRRAARELIGQRPTAILAGNDMMAIGCIRALAELNVRVPEDIAVVGADDTLLARYFSPQLTTIRQSMYQIGKSSAEALIGMVTGDEIDPVHHTVPTELVVRQSCGAHPAGRKTVFDA